MNILEIKNLTIKKNNKTILDNINLKIKENEKFCILGANGAGKSSLGYSIMSVNGFKPQKGKIIFKNQDITNLSITEKAKKHIALAWQEPMRFQGLSVEEYLKLSSKNYKKYLKLFGLNPDIYLQRMLDDKLSGGERKRIELASVFASMPELVILDEPDSGIDINGVKQIIKTLKEIKTTIIIITHQREIAQITDRTAILCDGQIHKIGETKELLNFFEKCQGCIVNKDKTFVEKNKGN